MPPPPRNLPYVSLPRFPRAHLSRTHSHQIERTLHDLIRLRMHVFTKAFSNIDQPRTDRITKEQFYKVLQE